jgi:hypothetical protein
MIQEIVMVEVIVPRRALHNCNCDYASNCAFRISCCPVGQFYMLYRFLSMLHNHRRLISLPYTLSVSAPRFAVVVVVLLHSVYRLTYSKFQEI